MSEEFIKIGIDLGTTNSEVAVFVNGKVEIVKNILQDSFTPSVFGIDKVGNKIVGKKSYENLYKKATKDEVLNNKAEVKRLMGTADKTNFPRLGKSLSAEEISAEILKSLKEDIGRKYADLDTSGVVITVPAYFSILQSEATKRAGILAGFKHVVLLQEPIAAAISYGFQSSKNQNWLVYDFGGGTFDVALITSRDGALTVLESGGDNYLGGKNIDLAIVDEVIVPEINSRYKFKEFTRSNSKYSTTFSKLKYLAERAKIDLSQSDKTLIEIELNTDDGQEISFDLEFDRARFEKIIDPIIKKTASIAKETIKSAGLAYSAVSKVILVGGPTQIPYLRKAIEDSLKIKVDTSIDCLTAVAVGACLYGLNQRIPEEVVIKKPKNSKAVSLKLTYPNMTSDTDEPISGLIKDYGDEEYYIQIQSESGLYTSPKILLKNGKFIESITIEPNKANQYWIYLFDAKGEPIAVEPDSFIITHGLPTIAGAPIARSIGVAIQKTDVVSESGEMVWYFKKGSILPLVQKTETFRTAHKIAKGASIDLPIVFLEGESENPANNIYICHLTVNGTQLPHDLPIGTAIDVTISMTESRELEVSYYIPSIDKGSNSTHRYDEDLDVKKMTTNLQKEKENFEKVSELCNEEERKSVVELLESAKTSLENAGTDEDEGRKANNEIKEVRSRVEKISESKKSDKLKQEYANLIEVLPGFIENIPNEIDKEEASKMLSKLRVEGDRASSTNNEVLLAGVNEKLLSLAFKCYYSNPNSWVEMFNRHSQGEFTYTNPQAAQYFIEKGKKAVTTNNLEEIKDAVNELQNLRVNQDEAIFSNMVSGLTH